MSIDLDAIKARLAKATPGPWLLQGAQSDYDISGEGERVDGWNVGPRVLEIDLRDPRHLTLSNAELIANAPSDLAALVAEVERLRERIADFEDDFRKVTSGTCAPDERHCSCVPHLRAEVSRLRSETSGDAAVVAWLRANTCGCYDFASAIERGEHRDRAPERSCFTCRWADRDVCDRPHTSEEMDADIDAYAVAAGCHYNNGGMPTDRTVACPGHEPKAPEGCAHVVDPFRVDPDGTVVGRCALCGDNTFVIREGGADTVGQFAIWTEHVTAPNRMPEPNTSLEGMISSEIGEVKAGTWLLSSGNGATHWRLHSLYPSFEDAYAAHRNLLSGVNR